MVAQGWDSPPGGDHGVDYRTAITEAGESTVTTPPADTTDLITPSAGTLELDRYRTEISPTTGSPIAGSPGTSVEDQFLANGYADRPPLVRQVPVSEVIQKTQEAVSASKAGQRSPGGRDLHLHSDEPSILKHISALRKTEKTKTDTDECEIVPYEQMQSVDEEQAKQDEERVKLLRDLDRDLERELNVRYTDEEVTPLLDVGGHDDVGVPFAARVAPGRPVTIETRPRTLETKDISHKTELPPEEKVVKTPDTPIETLDFPPSQPSDPQVMVSRSDDAVMRSPPVASTMAASDTFLQQEQEIVLVGEDTRMFAAGSAQLETSPELRTSIPEQAGIQQFKPETLLESDILKSQEPSVIMDTDISASHSEAIVSPPSGELFFTEESPTLQSPFLEDKTLIQQTDITVQGDVRLRDNVTKPEIGHEISPADLEMKAEGAILEEAPHPAVNTCISHRLEEGDTRFQPTIGQQPPVGLEGQLMTQQGQIPDESQTEVLGNFKVLDSKDIFMPLETEKVQVAPVSKIEDTLEEQLQSTHEIEISKISSDAAKIDEEPSISATIDRGQVQFEEPKVTLPQEELIVDVPEVPDVPEEELIVEVPKALADLERGIQPETPMGAVSQEGLQLPMPGVLDAKELETPATQFQTPVSKEQLGIESSEAVPEVSQVEVNLEEKELAVCEGLRIETPEPVPVSEGEKIETPAVDTPSKDLKVETPTILQEKTLEEGPVSMLAAQKISIPVGVEVPVVSLSDKEMQIEAPVEAVEGVKLTAPEIQELEVEAPSLAIPEEGLKQEALEAPEAVTTMEGVKLEAPGISELDAEDRSLAVPGREHTSEASEAPKSVAVAEGALIEASDTPEVAIREEGTLEAAEQAAVTEELEPKTPEGGILKHKDPGAPAIAGLQEGIVPQKSSADLPQEISTPTEVPMEESQIETPEALGEAAELQATRKSETEATYVETAKEIVDSAVVKATEKFAEEQAAAEPIIVRGSTEAVERIPESETPDVQHEFTDIPTPGSAEMEMLNVQFLSGVDTVHDDDALISEILGEDTAAATAERPDDLVAKPETEPITKEDILTQEAFKPTEVEIARPDELKMEHSPAAQTPKVEEAHIQKLDEVDIGGHHIKESAIDIAEETKPEEAEKSTEEDEAHKVEQIDEPEPTQPLDAEILGAVDTEETVKSEKTELPIPEVSKAPKEVEPEMADVPKPLEAEALETELSKIPIPDEEQTPKSDLQEPGANEIEQLGESEMEKQTTQAQELVLPIKETEEATIEEKEFAEQKLQEAEIDAAVEAELDKLPAQEPSPEELPQEETRPEELPEQETRPEKLSEQEPRPQKLPQEETRPEELLEQGTEPKELPEEGTRSEELPDQEAKPEELPEQDTKPEESLEQEDTYRQAAKEIVAAAISGATQQYIKEQAESTDRKPAEKITQELKQEDKPDELVQIVTPEALQKSAEIDIGSAKLEELHEEKVTEGKVEAAWEDTPEDKMEVSSVATDDTERPPMEDAKTIEPVGEVTTEEETHEGTPSDAVVEESEPKAAPSETAVEITESEVTEVSEEKVPEDETPKEPSDRDVSAEPTKESVTEDKQQEPSPMKPIDESVEYIVPEKVQEPSEEATLEDKQRKLEATTGQETQGSVEEIIPVDQEDQQEPVAEGVAGAETDLKPGDSPTVKVETEIREPETETNPEEPHEQETEIKPEERHEPETQIKPEEPHEPETETKPEDAKRK